MKNEKNIKEKTEEKLSNERTKKCSSKSKDVKKKKENKEERGISLITLAILIVIIIIITSAIVITVVHNNIIGSANETVFKNDLIIYKNEVEAYKTSKYDTEQLYFDEYELNVFDKDELKDIISSMKQKDIDNFQIIHGELVYSGTSDINEIMWARDVGIKNISKSTGDLWEYNRDSKTITRYLGTNIYDIEMLVIPSYIDDNVVTNIDENLITGFNSLTTLVISEGIEKIGPNSFSNSNTLKNAILPKSLKTIDSNSFYNDTSLENVLFLKGIENINEEAFANCSSLEEIVIPSSIQYIAIDSFYNSNNLKTITINNLKDSISNAPWGASNAKVIWK